jgi:hypothetical protein
MHISLFLQGLYVDLRDLSIAAAEALDNSHANAIAAHDSPSSATATKQTTANAIATRSVVLDHCILYIAKQNVFVDLSSSLSFFQFSIFGTWSYKL